MADLRVQQSNAAPREAARVASDGRGGGGARDQQRPPRREGPPEAPELALALSEEGRSAMEAQLEHDAEGNPRIRIVDRERGETVAVLSPEELRALTEQTGLPPGLLVRATS